MARRTHPERPKKSQRQRLGRKIQSRKDKEAARDARRLDSPL